HAPSPAAEEVAGPSDRAGIWRRQTAPQPPQAPRPWSSAGQGRGRPGRVGSKYLDAASPAPKSSKFWGSRGLKAGRSLKPELQQPRGGLHLGQPTDTSARPAAGCAPLTRPTNDQHTEVAPLGLLTHPLERDLVIVPVGLLIIVDRFVHQHLRVIGDAL